jgi:UDP-N-acetylglucosamine 2-epimerase (non-hydrolysing)
MVAFWRQIPVVHVEAGLRTGNLKAPFPEEANRKIIDHICALHLAPTESARCNLQREGIAGDRVIITGNTAVDAIQIMAGLNLPYRDSQLASIEASGRRIVLVTCHRRESWGEPLRGVLSAIRTLVEQQPEIHVVLPVHPNPAVRNDVNAILGDAERVFVCGPLPYASLARLLERSYLVITDSGGIQEEAPTFGVPVLVVRDVTEREEAVKSGYAKLVGTDPDHLLREATALLENPATHDTLVATQNPFGDGLAARRTVHAIAWHLGRGERPTEFQSR